MNSLPVGLAISEIASWTKSEVQMQQPNLTEKNWGFVSLNVLEDFICGRLYQIFSIFRLWNSMLLCKHQKWSGEKCYIN